MLLAEIHGKSVAEARDAEDYLTSAVFGHLRYVPPTVFWPELFAAACTVDNSRSLVELLPTDCTRLTVDFWPAWGPDEPDLVLTLHIADGRAFTVIMEVKLWSQKSGTGERDQLVRYLRADESAVLVYLTPRDPIAELRDSLRSAKALPGDNRRLFCLRWQTLQEVARRTAPHAPPPFDRLLSDVAVFLDRLELAGFDHWHPLPELCELALTRAAWATLFREVVGLGALVPSRAVWATLFRPLTDLDITPTPARWTHAS